MKVYRFFLISIFALMMTGCIYNKAPIVVATQTQSQLVMRRDAEEKYWLSKLKDRRTEFEIQLDSFVVGSQRDAQNYGLLTAAAIVKISVEEMALRNEFDANENKSLADLAENIKWYDDLILLQQKIIDSELQIEDARSRAFERLSYELEAYTKTLIENANTRRKVLAEGPAQKSVDEPIVDGVSITKGK